MVDGQENRVCTIAKVDILALVYAGVVIGPQPLYINLPILHPRCSFSSIFLSQNNILTLRKAPAVDI
jgi:hypothetical protein